MTIDEKEQVKRMLEGDSLVRITVEPGGIALLRKMCAELDRLAGEIRWMRASKPLRDDAPVYGDFTAYDAETERIIKGEVA